MSANERHNLEQFIRNGTPDWVIDNYLSFKDAAQCSDFGNLDRNVVVVDVEATGLSFNRDDIIQIAAAKLECGKIIDWYVTFVDPGIHIGSDIEELTGITDEDVKGSPDPNTALGQLVKFTGNALVLAHNTNFDKTFLTKHPAGYPLLENRWADTLDLSKIAFPRLDSHRLIDLAKAFSVKESTHRADDDVATTCEIYRICLAALISYPPQIISKISSLVDEDMWSTVYIFKELTKMLDAESSKNNNIYSIVKNLREQNISQIPKKPKHDVENTEDDSPYFTDDDVISADSLQFMDISQLQKCFSKEGILGKIYIDYEARQEQLDMANYVEDAFKQSQNLIIEAGTGVGKSMAYLVPAVNLAIQNNITVGVATKTNALLDQIIYSELPLLKKEIPDLTYSSLKGSRHYICLRRLCNLINSKRRTNTYNGTKYCNADSIAYLLTYIYQTEYDDSDNIKTNKHALPTVAYTTPSHECMKNKCPFYYNGCFVHGARRIARNSDIVVTNHSLLFCDIKSAGALLPKIRYWICDEAHNLESEARKVFSYNVSAAQLLDIANRLSSNSTTKNIFVKTKKYITEEALSESNSGSTSHAQLQDSKPILFGALNKCQSIGKTFCQNCELFANNMSLLLKFSEISTSRYDHGEILIDDKVRESQEFNTLYTYAHDFFTCAEALLVKVNQIIAILDDFESCSVIQKELAIFVFEVTELIRACDVIFENSSDKYFYYADLNFKNNNKLDVVSASLFSVAEDFQDKFISDCQSCIMTSATIATGDSFSCFDDSLGFNDDTKHIQLRSSFNFDDSMTVYVANDIPEPTVANDAYLQKLRDFCLDIILASNGSILSLFTNRKEMTFCHDYVYGDAKQKGLGVICQKYSMSTKSIRDRFIKDKHTSLFALKSFWEGFDAPGSTLRGIIISRIPFGRPNDPLSKERSKRLDNAWFQYSLPSAVIETKQAVGRLIRKSSDKGFVVFADSRVFSKFYGKVFVKSMPTQNVKFMSCNDIVDDIYNNYYMDTNLNND